MYVNANRELGSAQGGDGDEAFLNVMTACAAGIRHWYQLGSLAASLPVIMDSMRPGPLYS